MQRFVREAGQAGVQFGECGLVLGQIARSRSRRCNGSSSPGKGIQDRAGTKRSTRGNRRLVIFARGDS